MLRFIDKLNASIFLLCVVGLILWLVSPLLAGFLLLALFVRRVMLLHNTKAIIQLLIVGALGWHLLYAEGQVLWRHHVRGRPTFDFAQFHSSEEMQDYFSKHYPVGSPAIKVRSDCHRANGKCVMLVRDKGDARICYYNSEDWLLGWKDQYTVVIHEKDKKVEYIEAYRIAFDK